MKQDTKKKRKKSRSALLAVLLSGVLAVQTGFAAYAGEEAIIIEETAEEAPVQATAETVMETPAAETGQEAPAETEIQETVPETQTEVPAVTEEETQETPDGTQDQTDGAETGTDPGPGEQTETEMQPATEPGTQDGTQGQTGGVETGTDPGPGEQTETETQPVTEPGWQDMTQTEASADTEVQTDVEDFGVLETETGIEAETETEEFTDAEPQSFTSTSFYIPDAGSLPSSEELFAGYAWNILYGGGGISLFGNYGESVLNETELAVYNELKTAVGKIAAGEVSDTEISIASDLGIESWVTIKSGNELLAEAAEKFNAAIDTDKMIDCLLVDCPYELYWYNKTSGGGVRTNYNIRTSTSTVDGVSTTTVTISGLSFNFAVASAYQDDDDPDTYTTDVTKTGVASAAVANAQAVITANAGKSDYEKLVAYKDYICNAVSYNAAASGSYTGGYGDPWQIIYVFDGDSFTNVVCEGYAKAFQYLCDLGGLTCYTVTGTMTGGTGAGEHMWNIVTLDSKNYLVDVTNSDAGTVGQDGSLFLAGTSGSVENGYTFGDVSFTYDADTKSLYGDSILSLASEDYTEPVTKENGVAEVVIGNGDPTYYKTITEAFAAVQSGDTATITLLRDAPVESGKITVSGDVTLVGGDHTISGTYASYTDGLLNIPSGAKLTITNGKIKILGQVRVILILIPCLSAAAHWSSVAGRLQPREVMAMRLPYGLIAARPRSAEARSLEQSPVITAAMAFISVIMAMQNSPAAHLPAAPQRCMFIRVKLATCWKLGISITRMALTRLVTATAWVREPTPWSCARTIAGAPGLTQATAPTSTPVNIAAKRRTESTLAKMDSARPAAVMNRRYGMSRLADMRSTTADSFSGLRSL